MSDELVPQESNVLLYTTPGGKVRIEVFFRNETFWLTLNRIADLFGTSKQVVSYHLKNIFRSRELDRAATVKEILTVQSEGGREVSRKLDYYNLDAVIAVGYRVNSYEATQFRVWATNALREFLVKGFVLDDERLKQGKQFGADYFEELLQRIREIRASERRFYLKITDIYEQCSTDYDLNAEITKSFFKTVQNKLHWAITGQTEVPGRLCILRKSETQCRRTLLRIRRKAQQGGPEPKAETLVCANFVIVFTTLDESELSARQVLEYYRLRWQIELVFKRLKTLLRAGHVPRYDDQSSKAWLYGKLLVALLAEKMIRVGRAVSPWGYLLPEGHENKPEGKATKPLA